jgi:hypothetical protein
MAFFSEPNWQQQYSLIRLNYTLSLFGEPLLGDKSSSFHSHALLWLNHKLRSQVLCHGAYATANQLIYGNHDTGRFYDRI